MRGRDSFRHGERGGRRLPPIHPLLRQRGADPAEAKPKAAPLPPPAGDEVEDPDAVEVPTAAAPKGPRLDGEGRPYITLAQFLKKHELAPSGGAAKHLARSGTVQVNGQAEDRPGRKLHQGDTVAVAGTTLVVEAIAEPPV